MKVPATTSASANRLRRVCFSFKKMADSATAKSMEHLSMGTTTLALYIMNTFTGSYDYGYASALAVISTLIMMVVAFVYLSLIHI